MKCLASKCEFDTDGEISDKAALGEKLQLMSFNMQLVQTSVPVQPTPSPSFQTTTQRRKPDKFPTVVGVDETQYNEDSDLKEADVKRQLVACCSKELQGILSRNLGAQQFEIDKLKLLKHMK